MMCEDSIEGKYLLSCPQKNNPGHANSPEDYQLNHKEDPIAKGYEGVEYREHNFHN